MTPTIAAFLAAGAIAQLTLIVLGTMAIARLVRAQAASAARVNDLKVKLAAATQREMAADAAYRVAQAKVQRFAVGLDEKNSPTIEDYKKLKAELAQSLVAYNELWLAHANTGK